MKERKQDEKKFDKNPNPKFQEMKKPKNQILKREANRTYIKKKKKWEEPKS